VRVFDFARFVSHGSLPLDELVTRRATAALQVQLRERDQQAQAALLRTSASRAGADLARLVAQREARSRRSPGGADGGSGGSSRAVTAEENEGQDAAARLDSDIAVTEAVLSVNVGSSRAIRDEFDLEEKQARAAAAAAATATSAGSGEGGDGLQAGTSSSAAAEVAATRKAHRAAARRFAAVAGGCTVGLARGRHFSRG